MSVRQGIVALQGRTEPSFLVTENGEYLCVNPDAPQGGGLLVG